MSALIEELRAALNAADVDYSAREAGADVDYSAREAGADVGAGPEPGDWFTFIAAAALEHLECQHMLRPRPWPPIPRIDDVSHQARWTIQRAFERGYWETGDRNHGMVAAADALIAEGWTPPPPRRTEQQRHQMIDAAVTAIESNVTNRTHAWNTWNSIASNAEFVQAIVVLHQERVLWDAQHGVPAGRGDSSSATGELVGDE